MSLHKEISFELEICQHLASHGWLYAEGDAAGYDRTPKNKTLELFGTRPDPSRKPVPDSESKTLQQQAANNTKEQFANSPDLHTELQNAIIESYDVHTVMSTQALNSPIVLQGTLDVLLNHSGLYEALRGRALVSQ